MKDKGWLSTVLTVAYCSIVSVPLQYYLVGYAAYVLITGKVKLSDPNSSRESTPKPSDSELKA